MYSTREKLIHFNQLVNPQAVEADLALLHGKNPQSTDFVRFDHAPEKNSEDILFALLDVCEHDEIVRNRREFFATENKDTDNYSGGNGTPLKGTGTENPIDGEGNGTPLEGTGTENPIDGEGNGTSEGIGVETDNVDNSVDNSSEEGKGNQSKKPATPKKKKKSTRK